MVRDVYHIHQAELDRIANPQEKYNRLVELNVIEQCINVIKIDHVQRKWNKTGYPMVHAWVYDIHNGLLKDLNVNLAEYFSTFRGIYDLKPFGE